MHVCVHVCVCYVRRSAEDHREAVVRDGMEEGAALCLGEQLDFLQKELERLQVCGLTHIAMHVYILCDVCVCVCAGGASCACLPAAGRTPEKDERG